MSLQCRHQLIHDQGSVKLVLSPAMSGLYVPTLPALKGLKTSRPHPSKIIPLHIWSPSTSSVLSLSQLCKRSSSWELREGGGREESRKQLSKPASDFPKWKQGEGAKAGRGRKGEFFKAFCTCLRLSGVDLHTPPVSSLAHFPFCPSSQFVRPLAP